MSKSKSYVLPQALLVRATELRTRGMLWTSIEDTFREEGHLAPNGQYWHNATVASQVLASDAGSHLRVRVLKKKRKSTKRKAKTSKSKVFMTPKVTATKVDTKSQIQFLKEKGFNPQQILDILSK